MDYSFSQQQEMFRRSVRDFLKKEWSTTSLRDLQQRKIDFDRDLYLKMAGLGWLGLMIPTEYGGVGGDWVDTAIFYEEAGRALLRSPHFSTVVLGGQMIAVFGTEEQKQFFLPKIAKGDATIALALSEPDGGACIVSIATSAAPDRRSYVIDGTKLFVNHGHVADYIIASARAEHKKEVALFLLGAKTEGINCTPLDTLSGERLSEVVLRGARVPETSLLAGSRSGAQLSELVDQANIMLCAEMVGGAQAALDMAVAYSKHRVQFGRPIASFQTLQHRMADVAVAIEGTRWLVYSVAWRNSQGLYSPKESAMAQFQAGQTYALAASESTQVHGAVGVVVDHDITLHYRKAKAAQLNLGFSDRQREAIAQGLGL